MKDKRDSLTFLVRVLLFSNRDVRVVEWHRNQHIPISTLEHAGLRAGLKCCGSCPQGEIPRVVSKCPFNSNLRARLRGLWHWAAWGSAACVCRDDWNNMTPSRRRGTRHRSRRRAVRRPRVAVCCGEWRGHVVPWRQANTGRDFNDHMMEGCGFPCRIWGIKSFALKVKVGKTTSDAFWGLNSWRNRSLVEL